MQIVATALRNHTCIDMYVDVYNMIMFSYTTHYARRTYQCHTRV